MTVKERLFRWTDEEIGRLLDLADSPAHEAAEQIGRSVDSVKHMRRRLEKGWSPQNDPWTEDDLDIIRSTPHLTAAQVGKLIGRTAGAVNVQRSKLHQSEGLNFGVGRVREPHHVGGRRLLARTCSQCGLLLDASWFSLYKTGNKKQPNERLWRQNCNRCHAQKYGTKATGKERPARSDESVKKMRASNAKLQAITKHHAHNSGQPWTEEDDKVLRDGTKTILEKALILGRTYAAVSQACYTHQYVSRVGRGDPTQGVWVITRPGEPPLVSIGPKNNKVMVEA